VAIDTVIPLARPPGQIPMTRHAAMSSVLKVGHLGAMALSAQLHYIGIFNSRCIRQLQLVVVVLIVARQTS